MSRKPSKREEITPPSSFSHTPLTPPTTDEKKSPSVTFPGAKQIVDLFKEIKSGKVSEPQPWTKFQLQPGEYSEIEALLLADSDDELWGFVGDKIRYDFDADRNQVTVRMPTVLHEVFIDDVKDGIKAQLRSIASSTTLPGSVVQFAQQVRCAGSADIRWRDTDNPPHKQSKNSPDIEFLHRRNLWPAVIIEVSYSQKRKNVARLADDYILRSKGNVKAVVSLDIEYRHPGVVTRDAGSREAAFSLWQPEVVPDAEGERVLFAKQTIEDQIFRDAKGNPTSSPGLTLLLSQFSNSKTSRAIIDDDQQITLSSEMLSHWLTDAEKRFQVDLLDGHVDDSDEEVNEDDEIYLQYTKKRPREDTPPEVLNEKDEEKFAEAEERDERKQRKVDRAWRRGQ